MRSIVPGLSAVTPDPLLLVALGAVKAGIAEERYGFLTRAVPRPAPPQRTAARADK
jgi:hypothetical protein